MKFRILKLTRKNGTAVFYPQEKFLFFWCNMTTEDSDDVWFYHENEARSFIKDKINKKKWEKFVKKEKAERLRLRKVAKKEVINLK